MGDPGALGPVGALDLVVPLRSELLDLDVHRSVVVAGRLHDLRDLGRAEESVTEQDVAATAYLSGSSRGR